MPPSYLHQLIHEKITIWLQISIENIPYSYANFNAKKRGEKIRISKLLL